MPNMKKTVQSAQGMLNQMQAQEAQNANQLNSLQQKEQTATSQLQQMEGMLNQMTNATQSYGQPVQSYYQGSGELTNTAGLANNANIGSVSTTGLASSSEAELSDY